MKLAFSKRSLLPILPSLVVLSLLLYFLYRQIGDFTLLLEVIQEASVPLLLIALSLQFLSYFALTWHHAILLQPFPGHVSLVRLFGVLLAMAFVETAIPLAGVSTTAVRVRLLREGGYSPEASIFTMLVGSAYLVATVAIAALAGLIYLMVQGEISAPTVMALVLVSLLLLVGTSFAVYSLRRPRRAQCLLKALAARWRAAQKRHKWLPGELPEDEQIEERVGAFYTILPHFLRLSQPLLWFTIGFSTLLDIISLGVCFWAFGYLPTASVILTAYGITILITMLGALPGGIGVAEAGLALAYTGLGIPPEVALPAAFSFRFMSYWLLRFIGGAVWYWFEHNRQPISKNPGISHPSHKIPTRGDDVRL